MRSAACPGSAMLQGLAQGVRNAAEQAVAAVGEVAAGVRDRFKAMLGIHSPSRVFATLGSALSLGLAQGVAAAGPAVVSEVGQLAQSLQAVPLSLANPDVVSPAQGLRLLSSVTGYIALAARTSWCRRRSRWRCSRHTWPAPPVPVHKG